MKNQKLCGVFRADCAINYAIFIGHINIVLPDFKGEKKLLLCYLTGNLNWLVERGG